MRLLPDLAQRLRLLARRPLRLRARAMLAIRRLRLPTGVHLRRRQRRRIHLVRLKRQQRWLLLLLAGSLGSLLLDLRWPESLESVRLMWQRLLLRLLLGGLLLRMLRQHRLSWLRIGALHGTHSRQLHLGLCMVPIQLRIAQGKGPAAIWHAWHTGWASAARAGGRTGGRNSPCS
jgi:hypothetical protein